jgi:hypothetical protein
MPDKVKAAEAEEVIFPNPHLDSTSGGITFTIYSGIPSGDPPSGSGDPIGLGGGGYVAPDPGTQVTFPPKSGSTKSPSPTVYMAICTQQHEGGAQGVDENGNWTSGVLATCEEAFGAAAAHEHAVDRVEAITGPVGVAIAGC